MSYVGIVSAINTAREGQAMGSKFSLWVPLRGLSGMLLMIPAPASGYSIIQMTVIWVVLNGVGAANAIWNVVLGQLSKGVAAVGSLNVNLPPTALSSSSNKLINALACMQTLSQLNLPIFKNYGKPKIIVNINPPTSPSTPQPPVKMDQSATFYFGIPSSGNSNAPDATYGSICGSVSIATSICTPQSSNCQGAFNQASLTQRLNIKINAVMAMIDALSPLAATIASQALTANYAELPPGYIQAATDAYASGLAMLAGGVNLNINQAPSSLPSTGSTSSVSGYSGWGAGARSTISGGINAGAGAIGEGAATAAAAAGLNDLPGAQTTGEFLSQAGSAVSGGIAQGAGAIAQGGAAGAQAVTNVAINGYNDTVGIFQSWEQNIQPVTTAQLSAQAKTLAQFGWIQAGSYYFALSQSTNSNPLGDDLITNFPTAIGTKPYAAAVGNSAQTTPGMTENLYNALNSDANRYILNAALTQAQNYSQVPAPSPTLPSLGPSRISSGDSWVDYIIQPIAGAIRTPIVNFVMSNMTNTSSMTGAGPDPIVTLGKFGSELMQAGELAIFGVMVASIFVNGFGGLCAAMGSGFAIFMTMCSQIFLFAMTVLVSMWSAGATLGVYVPLVPYIIFTSAAIGWMISVAESLVGAPIIALALTHPSGEELPGGLKQAIGILANIFLRPTLMIFGFVMASGIIRAALTYINFGFMKVVDSSLIATLFSFIPTIGIYVFLVLGVVNQAFQLIYELPSNILKFMGVSDPFQRDIKELVGSAKEGFQKGQGMGQSAVKGAFESREEAYRKSQAAGIKRGQDFRKRRGWD